MKPLTLRPGSMDEDVAREMEADDYHVRDYVRDGDVVLDVGANIGAFARFVHESRPRARVICLEPMPENHAVLERNVAGFAEVERVALAAEAGTLTIYDFGEDASACHSMFDLGRADATPVSVPAKTLEQLMSERGLERIRLLKLDCQGAEYEILPGTRPAVLDRVDYVSMEIHGWIAKTGAMLGEIAGHDERKNRLIRHLRQSHVPVHGDVDFDSVQVWARRGITSRRHRLLLRLRGARRAARFLAQRALRRG